MSVTTLTYPSMPLETRRPSLDSFSYIALKYSFTLGLPRHDRGAYQKDGTDERTLTARFTA